MIPVLISSISPVALHQLRFAAHRAVLSVLLVLTAAGAAPAQDASPQIKAEIERLQQSLKDKPINNPDFPEINNNVGALLNGADAALSSGWLFLSLERLGQAEDLLGGARFVDEKSESVKSGLPAFETEWNKVSLELAALDKNARTRTWNHVPLALQAISEAARGRAIPLLEGGQGFAAANGPKDGLFYVGQAGGEAAFSAFVYKLTLAHKAKRFPFRSFLPELEALQEKTNTAFQPPKSIDMHPRFIALNSTLKFARELDSTRSYPGALYQYLDAVRHYAMLDPVVPDAAKQAELRSKLAEEIRKTQASKRDDSILQILLERGEGWLSKANGAATSDDEWRAVRAIVEQVTPAYYAALKPAAAAPQRAGKTATLTLVRWPYT